jgi:shikimate kinase
MVADRVAADRHLEAQDRFLARPVAFVGFMGVGKTSVGRALAALLDRPFLDTDMMVEQRAGRSIPEIFRVDGEPAFRRTEREALEEALEVPGCVISLGGGAFSQPGCADMLLPRALVVHLYTPWQSLRGMLPELAVDRPLIRERATWQVQELFLARAASYRRAHLRVTLPRHGPAAAAAAVAAVLRRPVTDPRSDG